MRLHEEAAWAIAMAWQEQLQSRVRLAKDAGGAIRLVKSYEWVRFEAPGGGGEPSARVFGTTARYAAMTWLALSCVPGYSGAENPVFWRRVFDTLQMKEEPADPQHRMGCFGGRQGPTAVTDAIRFFPDELKPFPRFQLVLPSLPSQPDAMALCRAFCGSEDHPDGATSSLLQGLLSQLTPLIDRKRVNRTVDVDIKLHALNPNALGAELTALIESCSTSNQAQSVTTLGDVQPEFFVRQISFREYFSFFEPSDVTGLTPLLRDTLVDISRVRFQAYDAVTRHAFASFVHDVLRIDEHSLARVHSLCLSMCYISADKYEAICSALPHARSVHTLQLDRRPCLSQVIPTRDLAWLGYAIFHPDAAESSWKMLDLEMVNLTVEYADVLRAMSVGNNLLAILDGTPPTTQAYYSARLAESTPVYSEPRLSDVVLTLTDSSSRFDVCVSSESISTMTHWVCVIVPCWGRGYIQKHSIIDVIARQPSRSALTGLRVMSTDRTQAAALALTGILSSVGERMECLDIWQIGEMSSTTLQNLLERCPSLTSLHVYHNGQLWSDPTVVGALPQLQELGLVLSDNASIFPPPTEEALKGALQNLTALHISASPANNLDSSREALLTTLKHLPSLQWFHWMDFASIYTHRGVNPVPYTQARAESWRLVGIPTNSHLSVAQGEFSVECLVALLSVVNRKGAEGSSLGLLDQDLVKQIVGYATTARPRDVWVELYLRS
ncbi:hypothetical protein Poli38472_010191 [Pythium oligandrum]|uniref:Uncharacterized protein n=1 Tax=Pythium oligandrum TaxID=41045 RepID=A0A8K1C9Y5_PYTOL|nr:hypothetical protein Poli38472_010191 [Pythium oligandrum]|eukprot:TMW58632.1 hypothetical protein Poli38472_010191 [Pythium oligandrum]